LRYVQGKDGAGVGNGEGRRCGIILVCRKNKFWLGGASVLPSTNKRKLLSLFREDKTGLSSTSLLSSVYNKELSRRNMARRLSNRYTRKGSNSANF
jgi:hypothetical protein